MLNTMQERSIRMPLRVKKKECTVRLQKENAWERGRFSSAKLEKLNEIGKGGQRDSSSGSIPTLSCAWPILEPGP